MWYNVGRFVEELLINDDDNSNFSIYEYLVIKPHYITNYYQTIDTIYEKTLRDTLPIMLANFKYGFFCAFDYTILQDRHYCSLPLIDSFSLPLLLLFGVELISHTKKKHFSRLLSVDDLLRDT